jgi:hypothetical protein
MNNEFEKLLQRQPMREPPREWRAEILAAAVRPRRSSDASRLRAIGQGVSTWLWPHPRAWAALAAAWGVVFLLQFSAPDLPSAARNSSPGIFQSQAILRQETLMMSPLSGSWDSGDSPAATPAPPKPRGEGPRHQLVG